MSAADDVAWAVQRKTREWLKENTFRDTNNTPNYFKPDVSFRRNGRVVPVSRLIAAAHLVAAKWMCQVFPSQVKVQLDEWITQKVGTALAKKIGKVAVGEAMASTRGFSVLVESALAREAQEAVGLTVERSIRDCFAEVRRDFNSTLLDGNKRRKVTRNVASRHKGGRPSMRKKKLEKKHEH